MKRPACVVALVCVVGCATPSDSSDALEDSESAHLDDTMSGSGDGTGTDTDTGTDTGSTETDTGSTDTTDTETGANLKPADAPDWVVNSVSGHCIPPACELPGTNHEYLHAEGTADRFVATLEAWGNDVQLWSYSDEFYNRDAQTADLLPGEGDPIYFGFLQMYEDLSMVRDAWIADFDDPTKVLVIAHSHGVVWAHTVMLVLDDVPIEVAIDLDGKSLGWEDETILLDFGDDWDAVIDAYDAQYNVTWPFDLGDAETGWEIPGQGAQDVEDVVADTIGHNLEIQAIVGLLMPFPDDDPNHRLDGSTDGITLFESNSQDHMEIHDPNGQAINWAIAQFAQLVGP